jgi:hypothetical protein
MNLKEYKSRKIRRYQLPSGLILKVRSLSPYKILEVRSKLIAENKEVDPKHLDLYDKMVIDTLFKDFIIEPIIGEEIEIEDFDAEDFAAIRDLIFSQIIVTKAQEIKELKNNEENQDFSTQSDNSASGSGCDPAI